MFLLTGAMLTLLGVVLGSGAVGLTGVLLLLVALLHGPAAARPRTSWPDGSGVGETSVGVSPGHAHIRHIHFGEDPRMGPTWPRNGPQGLFGTFELLSELEPRYGIEP